MLTGGAFVQGYTFLDSNGNGQLDVSDSRQSGAVVKLFTQDGATLLGQATTGADGYYRFDDSTVLNNNLTPGTYRVVETPPAGFSNSAAQAFSNALPATVLSPSSIEVTIPDPAQMTATFEAYSASKTVTISVFGAQRSTSAGQFTVSLQGPGLPNPGPSFLTICVDLQHSVSVGQTYPVRPQTVEAGLPNNGGRIAYLYNHYGQTALPAVDSAGLQLAIWELENDAVPDLNSGNFQYISSNPPTADDVALLASANFYISDSAGKIETAVVLDSTGTAPDSGQGVIATGNFNFGNTASGDLSITKTDGLLTVSAGMTVTYTIVVSNSGPGAVTGAIVRDTFPTLLTNVSYVSQISGSGSSSTPSGSNVTALSDTITLGAGSSITYTVTGVVSASATAPGTLVNTATVTAPDGVIDIATDIDTITPPDLSITKTDGLLTVSAGMTVTYTIVVSNSGPGAVVGAIVRDTFPTLLTNVSYVSQITGSGSSAAPTGSNVTALSDTITLGAGSSITYTVTGVVSASATAPGTLVNTATVTVPNGPTDSATDIDTIAPPFVGVVAIGNFVWEDSNGNGIQDSGESGIPGVTLTLTGTTGAGVPVTQTTTTDVNGLYQFGNLPPGTYAVSVTPPAGYTATITGQGTAATDSNASPSGTTPAVLLSGGSDQTIDFGYFKPVTIGNYVWVDSDANGVQDTGESGAPGVTLTLTGTTGAGVPVTQTTTTDATGTYQFGNLPPGTYVVSVTPPAGYTATVIGQGTAATDSNASPSGTTPVALLSGGSDQTIDFGVYQLVRISGTKFQDGNGDGSRQAGEAGLPGWTIFLDGNGNGLLDGGEVNTTTDASGNFGFTGLIPGTYTVREVQQAGWVRITAEPASIALTSGQNASGVDFGNFKVFSISGQKFEDANGNRLKDPGEIGLKDWVIFLDANGSGAYEGGEPFVVTDAQGNYNIPERGPGIHRVFEIQQTGWFQNTDNPSPITGQSGVDVTGVDFGNLPTGLLLAAAGERLPLVPTSPLVGGPLASFGSISKLELIGTSFMDSVSGVTLAQASFVNGLYQNVLGRSADSASLTYWVQILQAGASRADVANVIWQSAEHRALEVNQFYVTFLNRPAEAAGLAYWTNVFLAGATETDVMGAILQSPEYQASHVNNVSFVTGLYNDVLGRSADQAGQMFWLQALMQGASRAAVIQGFLTSAEAQRRVVDDYYASYLGRSLDDAGQKFWLGALQNRQASLQSVGVAILASDEYFARANRA